MKGLGSSFVGLGDLQEVMSCVISHLRQVPLSPICYMEERSEASKYVGHATFHAFYPFVISCVRIGSCP